MVCRTQPPQGFILETIMQSATSTKGNNQQMPARQTDTAVPAYLGDRLLLEGSTTALALQSGRGDKALDLRALGDRLATLLYLTGVQLDS